MTIGDKYLASAKEDLPKRNRHFHVKPPEARHYACAKAVLRRGAPLSESLIKYCNYSKKQAAKGLQIVRRVYALRTAFAEEAQKIEQELIEAPLSPNVWGAREALILQRLEKNVRSGQDGGTMSAKLLGSHKALGLWQADSVTGVIIVTPPPGGFPPILPVPEDDDDQP